MAKAATVSLWVPRMAGIAMSAFLAVFAFDAFGGKPFLEALPEFLIHLAPAAIVLAVVALAWRYPLAGAGVFGALAAGYAAVVHGRPDWTFAIAGPLEGVGALLLVSGLRRAAATVSD